MPGEFEAPARSLVLTGASGFIGRAVLHRAREHYHVYALARRSQDQAGVVPHRNVEWMTVDITDRARVKELFQRIQSAGGADFLTHLAGYYSFENRDEPEYELTNVQGTRNILEQCLGLDLSRFVFASSLVVSEFPPPGEYLSERSPPNASFPYARSKRIGEELTRQFSGQFPCSVVRIAATFSDWCEYGPFYVLLTNWLGRRWSSRILAGRGLAAQPFIHIDHVVRFFLALLQRSHELPGFDVYTIASDETYSHRELFETATRLCYGEASTPILLPKSVATLGVAARDILGRMMRKRPFERLWMMKYVDRQLRVDTSYTRSQITVPYKPRFSLKRRFPYMLENMLSNPSEWRRRNAALLERKTAPPNMVIAGVMHSKKKELLDRIVDDLREPSNRQRFPHYQRMARHILRWNVELVYDLLMSSVRRRERTSLLSYARYLACVRQQGGFPFTEVKEALTLVGEILLAGLRSVPELQDKEQVLIDSLRLTIEMVVDEVEAAYEAEDGSTRAGDLHSSRTDEDWPVMRKRKFLQSVIDSMSDPIFLIDRAYRIRMMNRCAQELHVGLGSAPYPLLCYQVAHNSAEPCSGEHHPCPLKEVLRTGEPAKVRHTHFDHRGAAFEVAILASPLFGDDGDAIGIIESTYRLTA